jgi:hypothetical protein
MSREYLDFDVAIEKTAAGYSARVVDSPAGQAAGAFVLPFEAAELAQFMIAVGPPRVPSRRLMPAAVRVTDVRDYGQRLNDALFGGPVGSAFTLSLDRASAANKSLRIRLRLAGVPELDAVPWEYLYSNSLVRFLTLSDDTPIVRYLDAATHPPAVTVEPPLRVLAMVSSPSDMPALEVQREIDLLKATTADLVNNGLLTIDVLDKATLRELQRALIDSYHVFHFIGHGGFETSEGEGVLVLEKDDGTADRVSGVRLGTLLHDARDLQLTVLNACEGARTSGRDAFSGVAQTLVRQGLPAVVAMQTEISDRAALTFSHEFYYFLSRGLPIESAMCEVRKAMAISDEASEWGTAVLLRSGSEQPFQFATTRPVSQPAKEERWESLYQAAGTAIASGAQGTAIPILEQLQAEKPDYHDVTELLEQVRPSDIPGATPTPGALTPATSTLATATPTPAAGNRLPAVEATGVPSLAATGAVPLDTGGTDVSATGLAGERTEELPLGGEQPAYGEGGPPTAMPPGGGSGKPRPQRKRILLGVGGVVLALVVGGTLYAVTRPDSGPPPPDPAALERVCGPAATIPEVENSVRIGCALTTPVIDGQFDDWGSQSSSTVDTEVFPTTTTAEGFSADWAGSWDREALYLHARVTDPSLRPVDESQPSQFFKGDSISFEFGPDPEGLSTDAGLRNGQDLHVMIGLTESGARAAINPAVKGVFTAGDFAPEITAAAARFDGGYEIEARVPWSALGVDTPSRGAVFGANFNVSDAAFTNKWALGRMISSNPERTGANQPHPGTWQRLVLGDEP